MLDSKKERKKKNLQLKLIIHRYYQFITVFIVMAIIISSYYFILGPKYRQVGVGGRYNLNTLKQELAECQNYLRALKELVGNYEKIDQEKIDKLAGILPDQKDIAPLLIQLQALAEEYGFLIADISFNEIPEPAGEAVNQIKKIDISLNLISNGSDGYSAIKEFLSGLEYNLRLFDVNAVHFISIDPPAYLINISTYYSVGLK